LPLKNICDENNICNCEIKFLANRNKERDSSMLVACASVLALVEAKSHPVIDKKKLRRLCERYTRNVEYMKHAVTSVSVIGKGLFVILE
jgi:hypothetical protein